MFLVEKSLKIPFVEGNSTQKIVLKHFLRKMAVQCSVTSPALTIPGVLACMDFPGMDDTSRQAWHDLEHALHKTDWKRQHQGEKQ